MGFLDKFRLEYESALTKLLLFMDRSDLQPIHHTELIGTSGINPSLVALNFVSIEGNSVYDRLLISPELPRNNIGQITPSWMRRYHHCTKGGWWCSGLDPLNDWQSMEWGTFKPDLPLAKPSSCGIDNREDKVIKYEHPPHTPTRLFCLRVTPEIWIETAKLFKIKLGSAINLDSPQERLRQRYGAAIGYWQWIIDAQIPVILCEGVKKAATLLSYGYPAIALPGINSGYRAVRDLNGNTISRHLIPDLKIFADRCKNIYICFDYEHLPRKAKLVDTAIVNLGELFQQSNCTVKVIRLPGVEKGVDDFIAAHKIDEFRRIYHQALDLEIDLAQSKQHSELTYQPNLSLNTRYLHDLDLPKTGIVGIKSPKGTGKTVALIPVVAAAQSSNRPVLLLTHRIQLGRFLCDRVGVNWIDRQIPAYGTDSLGLCLDSLWKINPADWDGATLILDEVEQSLWHLLHSSTCKKKRLGILKTFGNLIARIVATGGLIIAQDADLSDLSMDYLRQLANTDITPWIVVNHWQADRGWDVHFYDTPNPTALIHQLELDLRDGHKCYVTTDSRSGRYGSDTTCRYIQQTLKQLADCYTKTLVVCSHTTNTTGHPAVDFVSEINTQAPEYDAVFVTPTLGTGVSIDVKHFDRVYGIFQGVIPDPEVRQALARVRANVPRHLWCAKRGIGTIGNGSNNYRTLADWYQASYQENYALMCPITRIDVDLPFVYDPIHLRTWARFAARINASITLYRDAVKSGLLAEGHTLQIINQDRDRESLQALRTALMHATKVDPQKSIEIMGEIAILHKHKSQRDRQYHSIETQTRKIQQQVKIQAARAIAAAPDLHLREYQYLANKRFMTNLERAQVEKYKLQQRYGITISPELKLKDDKGYYGQLLTHFYLLNHQQYLPQSMYLIWDRDLESRLDRVFLPDANHHILKIQGLLALGIVDFLDPNREFQSTDPDLVSLKRTSYLCSQHIKRAIGIDIPHNSSGEVNSIVLLNRFLQLLGLKVQLTKSNVDRSGKKIDIYQLDRTLLNDERREIFEVWQHQQSKERPKMIMEPLPAICMK